MILAPYTAGPINIASEAAITTWPNTTGRDQLVIITCRATGLSAATSKPTFVARTLTALDVVIGDTDTYTQTRSAVSDGVGYRSASRPLGPVLVAAGEKLQLRCAGLPGDTTVSFAGSIIDAEAANMTRLNGGLTDGSPTSGRPVLYLGGLDLYVAESDATRNAINAVSHNSLGASVSGYLGGASVYGIWSSLTGAYGLQITSGNMGSALVVSGELYAATYWPDVLYVGSILAEGIQSDIIGDVTGKIIGGGGTTITGVGVRADDRDGEAVAKASAVAAIPTASDIAAAVWAATTRTLTSIGTLVADIWSYATRRLSDRITGDGSVIMGTGDYTAPDNAGITAAAASAASADGKLTAGRLALIDGSAQTGADGDTLETLSDQLDGVGASVSADIAAVKTDTGNIASRITSTLFTGITSLAEWLGLMAGKQVGNSTARTELRATGSAAGTFDETTDSQEALRDRGDAAWKTGDAVVVAPLQTSVVRPELTTLGGLRRDLSIMQHASGTYSFTITDADGVAISQAGDSIEFVIFDAARSDDTYVAKQTVGEGIVIGGVGDNQLGVTVSVASTATFGAFRYVLRNVTDGVVHASGAFDIIKAPTAAV